MTHDQLAGLQMLGKAMQCTCIQLQHTGEHTFGMYMHRTMLNDIPTFLPPLQSLSRSATILLLLPVIVCESQLHPLVWHMNAVHTRNNMQCLHTVCLFACKSYAQHRTIIYSLYNCRTTIVQSAFYYRSSLVSSL